VAGTVRPTEIWRAVHACRSLWDEGRGRDDRIAERVAKVWRRQERRPDHDAQGPPKGVSITLRRVLGLDSNGGIRRSRFDEACPQQWPWNGELFGLWTKPVTVIAFRHGKRARRRQGAFFPPECRLLPSHPCATLPMKTVRPIVRILLARYAASLSKIPHGELSTTSTGSPPPPYRSAHSSSVGIRPMMPILPSSCCTSTLSRHRPVAGF
jgi:hypothetical protein